MGVALGYTLLGTTALARGLDKLELNREALQRRPRRRLGSAGRSRCRRVMRRHGLPNPYERLKELTRGRPSIGASDAGFIDTLASCRPPSERD